MSDSHTIGDPEQLNQRVIRRYRRIKYHWVESACRDIDMSFYTPEVKRLFSRHYHSFQINSLALQSSSRSDSAVVADAPRLTAIRQEIEEAARWIRSESEKAAGLLSATDQVPRPGHPVRLAVSVFCPEARQYLNLLCAMDGLFLLLNHLVSRGKDEFRHQAKLRTEVKKRAGHFAVVIANHARESGANSRAVSSRIPHVAADLSRSVC